MLSGPCKNGYYKCHSGKQIWLFWHMTQCTLQPPSSGTNVQASPPPQAELNVPKSRKLMDNLDYKKALFDTLYFLTGR